MKKILKIALIFGVVAFVAPSCSNWLDVNENPNVPTTPNMQQLLSGAQERMAFSFSHGSAQLGNPLSVIVQHSTTREQNDFNFQPTNVSLTNVWQSVYAGFATGTIMPTINLLLRESAANNAPHFTGIAQVMKAFIMMTMVDVWGEIPFSQAFDATNFPHPMLDRGQDVYNALFDLLREARENLAQPANLLFPVGTADLIYGGNVDRWTRLANSLQFRMLVNTRNVRPMITAGGGWDALLAEVIDRDARIQGGRTFAAASDFEFRYTTATSPTDERNPGFLRSYVQAHTDFPSIWMWEVLNGLTYNHTNNPLAGISDPRLPFYIYLQLPPDGELAFTPPYRHGAFFGIFLGDQSGLTGAAFTRTPVWGVYPVGGIFDAGQGVAHTGGSSGAQGAVPQRFYTFADMLFNEAEMMLVGAMPGDARATFQEAIIAAFDHLHKVVVGLPGVPAAVITNAVRDAYIDAVLARFDNADADERMHLVMLQKWIHNVHNGIEAFTSLRRTGFPILFNPNNPNGGFDPESDGPRSTINLFPFPNTLPFPQNDVDRNPNMDQKDLNNPPPPFWQTINL